MDMAVLVVLHVPPGVASLNVIFEFTHTAAGPPTGAGNGFTVTTVEVAQPVVVSL